MEIQGSLFESAQQEQDPMPTRKKIGPIPMPSKSDGHLTKNDTETQYTKNIGCIEISKTLIGEPKKFRMTISDIANKMMELSSQGKTVYSFRIK